MKLRGLTERTKLIGVAGALMLILVAHGAAGADKRFDGVTLKIGTWGGIWRDFQEKIIAPKMQQMGAKIEYVTGSPQDNLAKLIAARGREPPFDVLDTFDASLPTVIQGGLFQRIDLKAVPNIEFLEGWQY